MKQNKKAQAVLPFFGLQLASIIVFLVVVISLLLLRTNLNMLANEFDLQTENILMTRRLLSSADCFAYEERDMYFYSPSDSGMILSGSRVHPYIIDAVKINDKIHFNCMRKDFLDTPEGAQTGIMDIFQGTGAAAQYQVFLFDLIENKFITGDENTNASISDTGYLTRYSSTGCFFRAQCRLKYGSSYNCVNDTIISFGWDVFAANPYSFGLYLNVNEGYCLDPEENIPRVLDYNYDPILYDLTTYSLICAPEDTRRSSFPVMIKTDDGFNPGVMYIMNCQIKGEGYSGVPFCERTFKSTGEKGC